VENFDAALIRQVPAYETQGLFKQPFYSPAIGIICFVCLSRSAFPFIFFHLILTFIVRSLPKKHLKKGKKRALFARRLELRSNRRAFPKFSPGLRKFLTERPPTLCKKFFSLLFITAAIMLRLPLLPLFFA